MSTVIAGRLVRPDGSAFFGWVQVADGRVTDAGPGDPPPADESVAAPLIAPGLCDVQVTGACGVEALAGGEALDVMDAELKRRGVLRWLANLPTAEDEVVSAALDAIALRAADPAHGLAGAHLEGPFLSSEYPGVHRPELLRAPADGIPSYYAHEDVRLVTLAPELPGAVELIGRLRRRGVAVSLGHSGADAPTTALALDAGARLVTHVFNAMSPLDHRAPGIAGVALTDPRALPCVIADGHHVDPVAQRLVRCAAGRRAVLVSDASSAAAAPEGTYALAGTAIDRHADGSVRTADGVLAGSGILLDQAVGGWVGFAGASGSEALAAASWRPAAAIGRPVSLRPQTPADLVLADEGGLILRVMRSGRWQ